MKITGRFDELYFLFRQATQSEANLIYLSSNGDVWLLYETSSYLFMRSRLDVSHSMMIAPHAFNNLYRFLKKRRKTKKIMMEKHLGYDVGVVEIATNFIRFNRNDDYKINIFTKLVQDSSVSDIAVKLRNISYSMLEMSKPYVKISTQLIKNYMRMVSTDLTEAGLPFKRKYIFDPHADETRNELHMMGYDFAITRKFENPIAEKKSYTFEEGYFVPRFFRNLSVFLSDSDLLFLSRIGTLQNFEEFSIIPFADHYVIEVNDGDILFKTSIPRVKHIELEEML